MCATNVCIEIGCLGETFATANVCAANLLSFFQSGSRVLGINVNLELPFVRAFLVTKNTDIICVLFADMGLKLGVCGKTRVHGSTIWVESEWDYAIGAEELRSSMCSFFVSS